MKTTAAVIGSILLAGCQATAVVPDNAGAEGLPPLNEARLFGQAACWRVELEGVPTTQDAWPAMCAPREAVQGCIETPTQFHCPGQQARRNLIGASL